MRHGFTRTRLSFFLSFFLLFGSTIGVAKVKVKIDYFPPPPPCTFGMITLFGGIVWQWLFVFGVKLLLRSSVGQVIKWWRGGGGGRGGSCSRPHVCHMQPMGHLRDFFTRHKFCGFFDNFFFWGGGGAGGKGFFFWRKKNK